MHAWHTKNGTKRDVKIRPKIYFPGYLSFARVECDDNDVDDAKAFLAKNATKKWVVEQITMLCILASPLQRKDWGEADLKNLTQIQIQKQVQIQIQTFEMVENFQ